MNKLIEFFLRPLKFKAYQKMIGIPLVFLTTWFFVDYTMTSMMASEKPLSILQTLFRRYLPILLLFFVHYLFLFQRYFLKDKIKLYTLGSIVLVFCYPFFNLNAEQFLGPASFGAKTARQNYIFQLYWGLIWFGLSFGYAFAVSAVRRERKRSRSRSSRQKLEKLKGEYEKSKLASELNFLKLQINPHFLYNALNTFYAQAIPLSMTLANGLLTLSNIMRYAVEGSKSDAKVSLRGEIDHINNLIEIQRMRFGKRFFMNLTEEGYIDAKQIPPLIFITFVENIFKHGEIHDAENPAEIKIFASPYDIIFITKNKKKTEGHKEPSTQVGIQNTLQRLNAYYPGRYELDTTDEGDFYTVKIKIKT